MDKVRERWQIGGVKLQRDVSTTETNKEYARNIYKPVREDILWNNVIGSNMEGPRDDQTKRSNSERERQTPSDITYMWIWNLTQMNLFMKQTYRHRRQNYGQKGGKGVGNKLRVRN